MVECILDSYPGIASWKTDKYDYNERNTTVYALHCACYNEHCPSSVIIRLYKEYTAAIDCLSIIFNGVHDWGATGLPLHYYLARTSNIDIDIVKMLVEACPQSLMVADETQWPLYPAHAAAYDSNPDDLHKVVEYLLEFNPTSLCVMDGEGNTPLHMVCESKSVNLSLVQLLFNSWPEAIRMPGEDDCFPVHLLFQNRTVDGPTALSILQFMLDIDQTIVRERDGNGILPIHYAALNMKSNEVCKYLINAYPESIRVRTNNGSLPIHIACKYGSRVDTVDTIEYMLDLYSESINARDSDGWLPIHHEAKLGRANIIKLLLKYDPGTASKVTENDQRYFPLHIVCDGANEQLDVVKILYDACPEATFVLVNGRIPLEFARRRGFIGIVNFLEMQYTYTRKARDTKAMMTPDENGWLPLHHALKDKAPLGSIKLLLKGNPSALRTADNKLAFPIHIACQFSSSNVVQHLVELDNITVGHLDRNKDSVLHYACRGGNCEVAKYLMDSHSSLVSDTNADNELPFHLLLECGDEQVRESLEYTEVCFRLLQAYPETVTNLVSRKRRRD